MLLPFLMLSDTSVVFVANPCPMAAAPAAPMLFHPRLSVTSVVFVANPCPMAAAPAAPMLFHPRLSDTSAVFVANPYPMAAAPAAPMLFHPRLSGTSAVFVANPCAMAAATSSPTLHFPKSISVISGRSRSSKVYWLGSWALIAPSVDTRFVPFHLNVDNEGFKRPSNSCSRNLIQCNFLWHQTILKAPPSNLH